MLKLTDYEQEMLDGKHGKLKSIAMNKIVQYANVLGASELCKVSKAHLFCGAHSYLEACDSDDIEEVMSEMHFCSDEKVSIDKFDCYCQSDCGPMDAVRYKEMEVSEECGTKNKEYMEYYNKCGVNLLGSCVPYMMGFIPFKGEHYVSSESHAVVLMNSLWGSCGNADGLEAGFWSAVCGRTPKWGNHIIENRKGTHLFNIECDINTAIDWDLLGYAIGRKLPTHSIPVIDNLNEYPDIFKIKYFFAAMATTSGPEMCHIVGLTPEADTVEEAFGSNEIEEVITIRKEDLIESYEILNGNKKGKLNSIDYISLGCPHYSIEEIRKISDFYSGKKIKEGTVVHVWTAPQIKASSDANGYTEIIENAGALVLTGSCPLTSEKLPNGINGVIFDSAKQAHYITPITDADVYYAKLDKCLELSLGSEVVIEYE